MIDIEQLTKPPFIQTGNTCVLASYAVAARYFTKIPAEEFFVCYCRYFALPLVNHCDAQAEYDKHFHTYIDKRMTGYQLVAELHNTSTQDAFITARKISNVEIINSIKVSSSKIESALKSIDKEALLNLTYKLPRGTHSITVGYYDSHYVYVNTAPMTGPYCHFGKEPHGKIDAFGDFDNPTFPLLDGLLITSK